MWSGCDGGEDTGAAVGCSTMGARGRTRVLDVAMDIVKSTQKDEGGRKEGARDGKEGSSWVDMCDGVCVCVSEWKGSCEEKKSNGSF